MSDSGSMNLDLGVNLGVTLDGAGLQELSNTIKEISKGKDLQRYWKDVESATDSAAKAIERYNKNVNSKGLAENLLKQINALKALTKKENLSELFPNMELNLDELVESAKKIVPQINSQFSVDSFSQAFKTFDLLKEKSIDLTEAFRKLADYADLVSRNSELSRENSQFRELIGDSDVEEVKSKLSEIKRLREQAEEIFTSFLKVNNVERTDYWGDEKFSDYFDAIRKGSLTATEAISRFKTEYAYLLEEGFKSNNDTFGLEQLQAFSNKLDSIFRQVEETSTKINDIISNGVITKSVENLSMDSSLSDSQRSLFGNLLQDEESLKSITALFQKLIEESNKTSKVDLFNDEQLQQVLSIFDKMEGHLSSLRSIISDVGDGEEFSPLLKMINNVQSSISELATSVKGIGLNMNIDVGSDSEMEAKVQSKIANALQAYQRLFDVIKMSGAGGSVINTNFFEFDINQYDTMMGKLQAYKKFIDNMRKEAKTQFNGKDVLYQDTDKSYWTQASSAMGQVTKAFNEMKSSTNDNPLTDMFGKTDLSEVVSQLNKIVEKLEEISTTASSFKEVFTNGFNVTTSVEEIDKLTNRVKELEEELSKVKLNPVSVDKSNISSENNTSSIIQSQEEIKKEVKETNKYIEREKENLSKLNNLINGQVSFSGKQDATNSLRHLYNKLNQQDLNNERYDDKTVVAYNNVYKAAQELGVAQKTLNKYFNSTALSSYQESLNRVKGSYDVTQQSIDFFTNKVKELNAQLSDSTSTSPIDDVSSNNQIVENQNKIQEELKQTQNQAEQTVKAVQDVSETPIKDVFQDNDKTTTDASTTAIKEESKALEQVSNSAKEASESKEKFANANKEVKASAETSSTSLNEEKIKIKEVREFADEVKSKLDDVIFKPNTDGFDEIVVKLNLAKDKIDEISKITKSSVWSESQGKYLESYNIKYKNGNSEIRGESSNKNGSNVLRANETAYDAKAEAQESKRLVEENIRLNKAYYDSKKQDEAEYQRLHAKYLAEGKAQEEKYYADLQKYADSEVEYYKNREEEYQRLREKYKSDGKAQEEKYYADLEKTRKSTLESYQRELNSFDNKIPKKPANGQRSDKFEGLVQNYKNAIKEAKEYLNTLGDSPITEKVEKDWENLISKIKEAKKEMDDVPNAARGSDALSRGKEIDTITKYLNKFTGISKQAKQELKGLLDQLQSGDPSVNVKKIHERFLELTASERVAGREARNLFDIFKEKKIYSFLGQAAGMFSFYDLVNLGREVSDTVIKLNTDITELAKVSEQTSSQIYKDFNSYADIAQNVRGTISDTISATADWSRNGYGIPDAKKLAEVALLYKNVGDGINIDDANESLISTLKGFQLSADQAEHIVDVFNEVDLLASYYSNVIALCILMHIDSNYIG